MEKKTIVWRDGDEQPAKNSDIVICPAGTNLYYIGRYIGKGVIKIAIPAERTDFDDVVEWAYISDVIAASKALDVAIGAIDEVVDAYTCQSYTHEVASNKMYDAAMFARKTISEIIGGK